MGDGKNEVKRQPSRSTLTSTALQKRPQKVRSSRGVSQPKGREDVRCSPLPTPKQQPAEAPALRVAVPPRTRTEARPQAGDAQAFLDLAVASLTKVAPLPTRLRR